MLKLLKHRLVEEREKCVSNCKAELENMSMHLSVMEEISEKEDLTLRDKHMFEEAKRNFVIADRARERQRTKANNLNKILCHI